MNERADERAYGHHDRREGNFVVAGFGNHCLRKVTADWRVSAVTVMSQRPRRVQVSIDGNVLVSVPNCILKIPAALAPARPCCFTADTLGPLQNSGSADVKFRVDPLAG